MKKNEKKSKKNLKKILPRKKIGPCEPAKIFIGRSNFQKKE